MQARRAHAVLSLRNGRTGSRVKEPVRVRGYCRVREELISEV